jgi:hypothetical protein
VHLRHDREGKRILLDGSTVIAAGAEDTATRYRATVQDVLGVEMRAQVERALGRPVDGSLEP